MNKWEQLLFRAKNDLITSKKGRIEPKTLDTAAYHCQQCAEKSLSSYLNYKGIDTDSREECLSIMKSTTAKVSRAFGVL